MAYIDREKNHGNSKEKNHFISSICTQQIYSVYQKTNHSDNSQWCKVQRLGWRMPQENQIRI